jgi:molybdopterin/thiamine biosynthesis adenylyltransferase
MTDRYDRQVRFFGALGQRRISDARIVMMGCGGLGMHVIQQLAYLGVQHWTLLEHDDVDETSLNRLISAVPGDVDTSKLAIAERLIRAVQPTADIDPIDGLLGDPELAERVTARVAEADLVIGCFDKETPRLRATELCSSLGVPYIDAATEIIDDKDNGLTYGGRVVAAGDGHGCVACLDVLDQRELTRESLTPQQQVEFDKAYGLDRGDLAGSGPSVVTLNGVVGSLAATEAMMLLTGLRAPVRQLTYRGHLGTVGRTMAEGHPDCAFCAHWRDHQPKFGDSAEADVS